MLRFSVIVRPGVGEGSACSWRQSYSTRRECRTDANHCSECSKGSAALRASGGSQVKLANPARKALLAAATACALAMTVASSAAASHTTTAKAPASRH